MTAEQTAPLDITRTHNGDTMLVHWRCPHSPQCTRGQIRTRLDVTELLSCIEDWHQDQHRKAANA